MNQIALLSSKLADIGKIFDEVNDNTTPADLCDGRLAEAIHSLAVVFTAPYNIHTLHLQQLKEELHKHIVENWTVDPSTAPARFRGLIQEATQLTLLGFLPGLTPRRIDRS